MTENSKPHYQFVIGMDEKAKHEINDYAEQGYRIWQFKQCDGSVPAVTILELVTPPTDLKSEAEIARLEATISALKASLEAPPHPQLSDVGRKIHVDGHWGNYAIRGIDEDLRVWITADVNGNLNKINPNFEIWHFVDDTPAAQS